MEEQVITTFVYNHDIAGLHRRINRFIQELYKSTSSSLSQVNEFDRARLVSYLDAIVSYHDWILDNPQLDLPETYPRKIQLDENPVITTVENESVADVLRMVELLRDEVTNSQSARQSSGLIKFDSTRILALVEKLKKFVSDYIEKVTPLDLPESTPMRAVTGHGQGGL